MTHVDPSTQTQPPVRESKAREAHEGKASGKNPKPALLLVVVAGVAALWLAISMRGDTPSAPTTATEEAAMDSGDAASPSEVDAVPSSLLVTANVRGASVFLNDRRVGRTPHRATPLEPGHYRVRVEQPGYRSVEEPVEVSDEEVELSVILEEMPSSVASATEAPDRKEAAKRSSSDAIVVKHKHRFGLRSCEGVLRVVSGRLQYETEHKDAFAIPLSEIEDWELEKKTLKFKIRGGRKYSFSEDGGDLDALESFHENVVQVGQLN